MFLALCWQPDIRVSSLILFMSDICQWNTTSAFSHGSPRPLLLTSISVRHPSITSPDGCDTACVPVTGAEQLTKKRWGCPKNCERKKKKGRRKRTRSGLPFGLDEALPFRSAKQIRIRDGTENICLCHTPSESICSPFQTEGSDRSRGSCLRLRP